MYILFDLRLSHTHPGYQKFAKKLVSMCIKNFPEHSYHIIVEKNLDIDMASQTVLAFGEKENKKLKKIIEIQKPAFCVFFHYKNIPNKLDVEYYVIHHHIKSIVFEEMSFLQKYFFGGFSDITDKLQKAKKNMCFESMTLKEINERLNVSEYLIEIIPPFFPFSKEEKTEKNAYEIDIKAKYNIKGEYFIYDASNNNESNIEKLIEIFEIFKNNSLPYHLIILSNGAEKDIMLREKILENDMLETIFFVGSVNENEQYFYYTQARGALYPSIYESCNFELMKSINYNTPVIMHKSKSNAQMYGTSFHYTNFLAPNKASERILQFIKSGENKRDYNELLEKLNKHITLEKFAQITKINHDSTNAS